MKVAELNAIFSEAMEPLLPGSCLESAGNLSFVGKECTGLLPMFGLSWWKGSQFGVTWGIRLIDTPVVDGGYCKWPRKHLIWHADIRIDRQDTDFMVSEGSCNLVGATRAICSRALDEARDFWARYLKIDMLTDAVVAMREHCLSGKCLDFGCYGQVGIADAFIQYRPARDEAGVASAMEPLLSSNQDIGVVLRAFARFCER